MDLIGLSISSNVISALIGRQLFSQAISDASNSIYGSLSSIIYYDNNIDEVLNKLDIKNKIKNVELLLSGIKSDNLIINRCIEGLYDIIIDIQGDIKQIDIKVKNHKNLYFSSWRYLNCSNLLNNLKTHSCILDNRLDFLIKSLNVLKY